MTSDDNDNKDDKTNEHKILEQTELNRWGIAARYMAIMARKSNFLMTSFRLYGRPMAYASEFGESFRPFVSPYMVNSLYGVSFLYVFADVGISCYNIRDDGREAQIYTALDQTVWHSMASLALPAVTIHQIVHLSGKYAVPKLSRIAPKYGRFAPILFGLGSIPFIIHPLDHVADFIMNQSLRKYWYGNKIKVHSH
eukprot:587546_1